MSDSRPRPDDAPTALCGPDGRPQFFSDPAMDRFVPVVLNLASELWVQAEAVANLVALVERKGLATAGEMDALARDQSADPGREEALRLYIGRVLAPLREAAGGAS